MIRRSCSTSRSIISSRKKSGHQILWSSIQNYAQLNSYIFYCLLLIIISSVSPLPPQRTVISCHLLFLTIIPVRQEKCLGPHLKSVRKIHYVPVFTLFVTEVNFDSRHSLLKKNSSMQNIRRNCSLLWVGVCFFFFRSLEKALQKEETKKLNCN